MLTVMFATHNRADILAKVLETFCSLQSPTGGWKLLVIDNGSTDATREVVHSFQTRLPLKYLYEAGMGKNVALNTGVKEISGDLVILTDDDVFPRFDWLLEMRAAADAHGSFSIFGGVILPRWEVLPSTWLLTWVPVAPTFTLTDPATPEGPTQAHNIFGPNMAVRAEIFHRGYRFDVSFGPRGANYPMGSETHFVRRLLKDGHTAWFCRNSVVEHFVRASQIEKKWILSRAVRFGRGQYRLGTVFERQSLPVWFGVPRYLFRQIAIEATHVLQSYVRSNSEALFRSRWEMNYIWGQITEARNVTREEQRAR